MNNNFKNEFTEYYGMYKSLNWKNLISKPLSFIVSGSIVIGMIVLFILKYVIY